MAASVVEVVYSAGLCLYAMLVTLSALASFASGCILFVLCIALLYHCSPLVRFYARNCLLTRLPAVQQSGNAWVLAQTGDHAALQALLKKMSARRLRSCVQYLEHRPFRIAVGPLEIAAFNGHVGCVQTLLTAGATIGCRGAAAKPAISFLHARRSALHFAAQNGDVIIVRMLLDAGASVNYRDCFLQTSLDVATAHSNCEAASVLTEAGGRQTPLHEQWMRGLEYFSPQRAECGLRMCTFVAWVAGAIIRNVEPYL